MRSILDVPARRRTSTVAQAGLPARVAVTVARVVDPAVACEARGETADQWRGVRQQPPTGSRHVRAVRSSRLPRSRRDRLRRPHRRSSTNPTSLRRPLGRAHLCASRRARPCARRPRSTRSASPPVSGWRSSRTTARACSIAFFGVSGFGRVLVPINFRLTADEIAYIVEHSGASGAARRSRARRRARRRSRASARFVLGDATDDRAAAGSAPTPTPGTPTRTRPPRSTTRAAPRPGRRAWS